MQQYNKEHHTIRIVLTFNLDNRRSRDDIDNFNTCKLTLIQLASGSHISIKNRRVKLAL